MWILHTKDSSKKIGLIYKLLPCLFELELEHDEFCGDNCEEKENECLS